MASTNQNIYPKPCVYNCGVQIYWNTSADSGITPPSNSPKPRYYNPSARKRTPYASSFASASKPKMSNSFDLLTGPY